MLKVGVEQGKVLVLIIDEGQNLPGEMLDVFRTLLNFETDDFKQVVNAANTLGLPEIVVEGDGTAIRLVVSDTGNVSSDIFSIKVGVTDKTFRMVFKTENLTKVMEGSYDIELSSKRISHFKRKSDSLEYWIALEQNSTYEG